MHWQDMVFTVGQLVFIVALFPSVLSKNKPALSTSLITGSVIFIYAVTFATLFLWLSVIPTSILAILWFVLAFQKYRLDKFKD